MELQSLTGCGAMEGLMCLMCLKGCAGIKIVRGFSPPPLTDIHSHVLAMAHTPQHLVLQNQVLYCHYVQLVSVGIMSPSGEYSGRTVPRIGSKETVDFILEPTVVYIELPLRVNPLLESIDILSFDEL